MVLFVTLVCLIYLFPGGIAKFRVNFFRIVTNYEKEIDVCVMCE